MTIKKIWGRVSSLLGSAPRSDQEIKQDLRDKVAREWPGLPSWSTLDHAVIEEEQKAGVGCGVLITFVEDGVRKVLVGEAGAHYAPSKDVKGDGSDFPASYTIAGGFINLSFTPGSAKVPASDKPEDPRVGAAREVEEEFKNIDGSPLLEVDPARLKPMDTVSIAFPNGSKRVVIGMALELNSDEVALVNEHLRKLESDPAYKAEAAAQTANEDTGLPEIRDLKVFTLDDVADGNCNLLHKDQQSLFEICREHYSEIDALRAVTKRQGPTQSFEDKVMYLGELKDAVDDWRTASGDTIGITSGVFDILHPGHISFLEDAHSHCDRLIVVIASDRTVKEQKGAEKPFVTELKRAQTIAAMEKVDAVIISDEKYHESILKELGPDILFKGDDYAGQDIIGADLVGKVVLIPCAEKEFYSSSEFARRIKEGQADEAPDWAP